MKTATAGVSEDPGQLIKSTGSICPICLEPVVAQVMEKQGQVAQEFDAIHSIQRARQVGSLDHILPPTRLRPYLIDAVERGQRRVTGE